MKGNREALKPLQFFFVITMALLLPLQAFAYKSPNIARTLPEAVTGSFYSVQLFAEGTGKNIRWSAEGLPEGLEMDPAKGILFGTAKRSGVFEFVVTAQSGWKWRPRIEIMRFRLSVLPQPVPVPAEPPAPLSDALPDAPPPDMHEPRAVVVEWLGLRANGISGLETTTELYLDFSRNLRINPEEYEEIIFIDDNAAKISGFSKAADMEYTYILGIEDIAASIGDGDEITVRMIGMPDMEPNEEAKPVQLWIQAKGPTDAEKVALVLDGILPDSLLRANQSADEITSELDLPHADMVYNCAIVWRSSDGGVISDSGEVTRPPHSEGDRQVTLTAAVQIGEASGSRDFTFTVKAQPAPLPEVLPAPLPEILPDIAPPQKTETASKTADTPAQSQTQPQTSANVSGNGAVSRASIINELKAALQDAVKSTAVIKTKNALSVSPKTLKALAEAAKAEGRQAVLHADTMTQSRKVDARLYVKPESLAGATEPIKLGIATTGHRPEKIKGFFEKYFDNHVSVISCEQKGSFGAKLQIAAKIKLPEETANLVFYSYNAETNTFFRILTAYRIDANGYLRFATEVAGDIVVSDGVLERR